MAAFEGGAARTQAFELSGALGLVANYEESVLVTESIFTARELDPYYSLVALGADALALHAWVFRRKSHRYERRTW